MRSRKPEHFSLGSMPDLFIITISEDLLKIFEIQSATSIPDTSLIFPVKSVCYTLKRKNQFDSDIREKAMYYQIEGRMNMKTITFDEDGLTVGKNSYPIDEVEELKITNAPLFATYGILNIHLTNGKNIAAPFPRAAMDKLRRAMHDFEHEQKVRRHSVSSTDEKPEVRKAGTSASNMDPYEELKKLKELLDMGILTEEEFQLKKKQLLGL